MQIYQGKNLLRCCKMFLTPVMLIEFLETTALAIFAVKSKARLGLLNTFFAIFLIH